MNKYNLRDFILITFGVWAQSGRPEKEIRAGTAQYQEVAQATPE